MRLVRRDRNHAEIKSALLAAGRPVKDVSIYGGLGCDLLTVHVRGWAMLLEVKDGELPPSRRALTDSEKTLQAMVPMAFRVVLTVEDALAAVGLL